MRDFIFHTAKNTKTGEQQLKMIEMKDRAKVEFTVNSRSTLQPLDGQPCRGVEKHALVDLPHFRRVVVDVQEIVQAEKVETVSATKAPEKKGLIVKVAFQKEESGIRATAFVKGATIHIIPTGGHIQPQADERWLVRVSRVRPVIGVAQHFTATGEMVKRLPDLTPATPTLKPAHIVPEQDILVREESVGESIELELVRGVNTRNGNSQWECRLTDSVGVTTLYVVDRESAFMPSVNGERWECDVLDQIYPKEDAKDFDSSTFRIILVEPFNRIEVALPFAGSATEEVVEAILPKALSSTGVIGQIGRRQGRSLDKRTQDANRRRDMKGQARNDDSKVGKKKQKSA